MAGVVLVSTHSRLKAAGWHGNAYILPNGVSTHSRLKAAGYHNDTLQGGEMTFQHTAA